MGGRVVHAAAEFAPLAPPLPPAMPDWSPVRAFGGYARPRPADGAEARAGIHYLVHPPDASRTWERGAPAADERSFWGALGCSCWAF